VNYLHAFSVAAVAAAKLVSTGTVNHGWLGIHGATSTGAEAGVRVTSIDARSAALEAGIRRGDTIMAIGGHRITSVAALQGQLYFESPGQRVAVEVVRSTKRMILEAVLDKPQAL